MSELPENGSGVEWSGETVSPEAWTEISQWPTPPRVQPGDKVRLIIDGKKWVGIYPDGPWEEES